MKKLLMLLSLLMLVVAGCNKESKLIGRWKSPIVKGFEAEFKEDHTGATYAPVAGHAGSTPMMQSQFKWSLDKDGNIKIEEGKNAYLGKFEGKKLELEINDAKTVLEKIKK